MSGVAFSSFVERSYFLVGNEIPTNDVYRVVWIGRNQAERIYVYFNGTLIYMDIDLLQNSTTIYFDGCQNALYIVYGY